MWPKLTTSPAYPFHTSTVKTLAILANFYKCGLVIFINDNPCTLVIFVNSDTCALVLFVKSRSRAPLIYHRIVCSDHLCQRSLVNPLFSICGLFYQSKGEQVFLDIWAANKISSWFLISHPNNVPESVHRCAAKGVRGGMGVRAVIRRLSSPEMF